MEQIEINQKNKRNLGVINVKKLIIELLTRLREQGLSYSQVGERAGLHKGQVCMILNGTWYPKKREIENRIYERLTLLGVKE